MTTALRLAFVLAAGFAIGFQVKHYIGRKFRDRQRFNTRVLRETVERVERENADLRDLLLWSDELSA